MAIERTLAIIKPNAVKNKHIGQIITSIENANLMIKNMRILELTTEMCKIFYKEHINKPFYSSLEEFMTEGPIIVLALEGENAIDNWRKLMGNTNPAKADQNTLRFQFGESLTKNATHGSDSQISADRELKIFFE